jgi:hypothetical protein
MPWIRIPRSAIVHVDKLRLELGPGAIVDIDDDDLSDYQGTTRSYVLRIQRDDGEKAILTGSSVTIEMGTADAVD